MNDPHLPALPHAGPARLLSAVVTHADDGVVCEGRIPDDGPHVRAGRCPAFVLIEVAAQAAAALSALEHGEAGEPPPQGYLVRATGIRLAGGDLEGGTTVRVLVRRTASAAPLFLFDVQVQSAGGAELMDGRIGIYVPLRP